MKVEVEPGVRLWFDIDGRDVGDERRPVVVLLHGGPGNDHSHLRGQFSRGLADVAQVVHLDQRGHGRSDGRDDPAGWTLATWGDDVVRFCDAIGVAHPVVLGHSFGGMVAMAYAGRHPTHPGRLVLMGTAGRWQLERVVAAFAARGGPGAGAAASTYFAAPSDPSAAAEFVRRCLPLYDVTPEPPDRSIVNAAVVDHFVGGEMVSADLLPALAAVACPTLVVAGALDPICPPDAQRELAAALPTARVELVGGAGHAVYRDAHDRVLDLVRSFVLEDPSG